MPANEISSASEHKSLILANVRIDDLVSATRRSANARHEHETERTRGADAHAHTSIRANSLSRRKTFEIDFVATIGICSPLKSALLRKPLEYTISGLAVPAICKRRSALITRAV